MKTPFIIKSREPPEPPELGALQSSPTSRCHDHHHRRRRRRPAASKSRRPRRPPPLPSQVVIVMLAAIIASMDKLALSIAARIGSNDRALFLSKGIMHDAAVVPVGGHVGAFIGSAATKKYHASRSSSSSKSPSLLRSLSGFPCGGCGIQQKHQQHQQQQRYNELLFHRPSLQTQSSTSTITTMSLSSSSSQSSDQQQPIESSSSSNNLSKLLKSAYDMGETDGVQDFFASSSYGKDFLENADNLEVEEIADTLVSAAINAASKNKNNESISNSGGNLPRIDRGCLAGILNAILASCCGCGVTGSSTDTTTDTATSTSTHAKSYPSIALATLQLMDELHSKDDTAMVAPDLVSLSLVYYALVAEDGNTNLLFESESNAILERAQKMAKKMAGSQRRKALAAERRRPRSNGNTGSEEEDNDGGCKQDTTMSEETKQMERQLQSLYGPDIHILHNSNEAIAISKPAGMVCYHAKKTTAGKLTSSRKKMKKGSSTSGSGSSSTAADDGDAIIANGNIIMDISLEDALLDVASLSLSTLNPSARGIVHRLDRGTSGCIVLAKTDDAHLRLVASFFLRRAKKKYMALVTGTSSSRIPSGKKRSNDGNVETTMEQQPPQSLTMGSKGVIDVPVDGRPARSNYQVIGMYYGQKQQTQQQLQQPFDPEAILLQVETLTGRKHQVRVHCATGLERPIFLDPLYSDFQSSPSSSSLPLSRLEKKSKNKNKKNGPPSSASNTSSAVDSANMLPHAIRSFVTENEKSNHQERFFLHAASLSIPELSISVNSPLPSWWVHTLDQMND